MRYEEWLARRTAADPVVELLVLETETLAPAGADTPGARDAIMSKYAAMPFSPRVWNVYFANTLCLTGVKRKDRRPYATHPTRMALSCYWLTGAAAAADDVAAPALLHDYLEESGGVSALSIATLRRRLPQEPLAVPAAVLLTEPDIDYAALGTAAELTRLKRIAYVVQAAQALADGASAALANAALADKLDNLHDLGYLEREADEDRRRGKLAQRTAFFALVAEHLGSYATPVYRNMLATAVATRVEALGLATAHAAELRWLQERGEAAAAAMRAQLRAYHRQLGGALLA